MDVRSHSFTQQPPVAAAAPTTNTAAGEAAAPCAAAKAGVQQAGEAGVEHPPPELVCTKGKLRGPLRVSQHLQRWAGVVVWIGKIHRGVGAVGARWFGRCCLHRTRSEQVAGRWLAGCVLECSPLA